MNEALKKALQRQREIADTAKTEERDLNEQEQREFGALQEIIDLLNERSAEEEKKTKAKEPADEPEEEDPENEPEKDKKDKKDEKSKRDFDAISSRDAADIVAMCRSFNMDATEFFERGLNVTQVRKAIIDKQMENGTPITSKVTITGDENDKFRRAVTDGIMLRGGGLTEGKDRNNVYRAMSLRDIAIECLERDKPGADYRRMGNDSLVDTLTRDFYNPVSAFPAILDDVVKKSYVEGLTKARVSFDKWVKFGTLPNFKKTTNHEYIMSLGGELYKVPENGELKAYVPQDVVMPERQLETYGRQFTMTRQAFIDDDIGFITTLPRRYAEMSMQTQNKAVYDIILNNNKIYDGKEIFSKDRKNTLTTGTDITMDAVQKMIYMIGIQKDAAGNQLALVPDLFIVPFGLGVEVQRLLTTPTYYSAEGTVTNPYYNSNFTVVEDVYLNGFLKEGAPMPWYMGMKNEIIQVDYLNGQKEATIRRSEKPGTLGFIWDVYFDFGVSVLHPEAICRNPGVVKKLGE